MTTYDGHHNGDPEQKFGGKKRREEKKRVGGQNEVTSGETCFDKHAARDYKKKRKLTIAAIYELCGGDDGNAIEPASQASSA